MRLLWLFGLIGVAAFGQVSLVLYSTGLALVEETRTLSLSGEGVLELWGFPSDTLWETLHVEGLDLLALRPCFPEGWDLSKLLGQEITVQTVASAFHGILREIGKDGLVLETEAGVVLVREYFWVRGPRYEPPSLVQARLFYRAPEPGEKAIRFRYLARGLAWEIAYDAEYVAGVLRLFGKVVVRNDTGLEFRRARISLVAGEVRPPAPAVRALAMAPEGAPTEAFEYYRYDLPGAWDLPRGSLMVPLVQAQVLATRAYQFRGAGVEVVLRFGADTVLPAGEMRVYTEGIYIGANTLGHTPKGKEVELRVGVAFDLWGSRVQVRRERLGENLFRDTWRIVLRSAKKEPVNVEVIETLSGYWRILSSTLPYEILDAQRIKFVVPVAGETEFPVEYTVEWRY